MRRILLRIALLVACLASVVAAAPQRAVAENTPTAAEQATTMTVASSTVQASLVSDQAEAQAWVTQVAPDWQKQFGVTAVPEDYAVYKVAVAGLSEPVVLIQRKTLPVNDITVTQLPDGRVTVGTSTSVTIANGSVVQPAAPTAAPAALPANLPFRVFLPLTAVGLPTNDTWERMTNKCEAAALVTGFGKLSICRDTYKMIKGNVPGSTGYALTIDATASPSRDDYIDSATVYSIAKQLTGVPNSLEWFGYSPKNSTKGDCVTVAELNLGVGGITGPSGGLTIPVVICEDWFIKPPGQEPGDFQTTWRTAPFKVWPPQSRQVAQIVAIKARDGDLSFSWEMGWNFTGHDRMTGGQP